MRLCCVPVGVVGVVGFFVVVVISAKLGLIVDKLTYNDVNSTALVKI